MDYYRGETETAVLRKPWSDGEAAGTPTACDVTTKNFDAEHGTKLYDALLKTGFPAHERRNIKPVESLTVADLEVHPVWEYLNDDEIGETFVGPIKEIPVKELVGKGNRCSGSASHNGFAGMGNYRKCRPVINPRRTTPSGIFRLELRRVASGFFLRGITSRLYGSSPEALARFLAYPLTMYPNLRGRFGDTFRKSCSAASACQKSRGEADEAQNSTQWRYG